MKIITRKDAKAQGLKWYFPGHPCPKGHIVEHYIGGGCRDCLKARANEWAKRPEILARRSAVKRSKTSGKVGRPKTPIEHKRALARANYRKHRLKTIAKQMKRYIEGPTNPIGDRQWLQRANAVNRALKALLKSSNPDLSLLRKLGLDL